MSAPKITTRDIIERFVQLKEVAKKATNHDHRFVDVDLHDAAMAYARAVRIVSKRERR